MRPTVSIWGYQITSMSSIGVVKMVVCLFDDVSETYS